VIRAGSDKSVSAPRRERRAPPVASYYGRITNEPSESRETGAHEAWPLADFAALSVKGQPELRFVAVTDGYTCSIVVLEHLVACGSLRWITDRKNPDAGEILHVETWPAWRRQGIANELKNAAAAYAEHHGLPGPRHSKERTLAGDAWAQADGAEPAEIVRDPVHRKYLEAARKSEPPNSA
jgi:GNAT superfamily N-acetyltransferase